MAPPSPLSDIITVRQNCREATLPHPLKASKTLPPDAPPRKKTKKSCCMEQSGPSTTAPNSQPANYISLEITILSAVDWNSILEENCPSIDGLSVNNLFWQKSFSDSPVPLFPSLCECWHDCRKWFASH